DDCSVPVSRSPSPPTSSSCPASTSSAGNAMTFLAAVGGEARFPGWHTHPDVWLLIGVLATGYWWATRGDRSRRRAGSFVAGLCVLWLASDWPIHDLAE